MLRTPREIHLARIAIHRRRGEPDVARRLYAELKRRDDDGDWDDFDDCPSEQRSLADLGLSLFACRLLEYMGVRYAGELSRHSAEELRANVYLGKPRMLKKLRVALGRANLDLRDTLPGERARCRPKLARRLERCYRRRQRRLRRLSEFRKRQIMYLVGKNISEREISRRLGYRSHSTVYAVKRELREKAG